ncbi:MAG: ferrous iron transport protein B [Eubacteriales bacterium]|nr:ferrous iron transport protein B [Eubacteriales bacterium]
MKGKITIALAGNPNSGKTTLFNALTGSNQFVGNWPGVTVEKKEGKIRGRDYITVQDLPGIYSLSPYTAEEVITRNYLVHESPDLIINIVDGSNLERNLYLTTQLLELNIPVVVALNFMDAVNKNGDKINIKALAQKLHCPVVGISALKKEGLEELIRLSVETAKKNTQQALFSFEQKIEQALSYIQNIKIPNIPKEKSRWYSIKLLEKDEKIMEELSLSGDKKEMLWNIIKDIEKTYDDEAESIITDERYTHIAKILEGSYKRANRQETVSDKIDKVLTNRWLALPIFAGIMTLMYYIAIYGLGTIVTDWTNETLFGEYIIANTVEVMTNAGAAPWLVSLVSDGILAGVAAPLGFVPQMALVFLFLALLQGSGYMARVAFIMDRLFRRFGLSGKSFLSFFVSSGCGVPGIMATRTIENRRDRDMTMITTTAIPCSAKLPVIAMISAFTMGGAWWVAPLVYFTSIAVAIMASVIMKKTKLFSGEPAPFVMELPEYRLPNLQGVLRETWIKISAYIKRAGTIIFAMCVLMWFLGSFGFQDGQFGMVESSDSFLAIIGGAISFIFIPLGFGNWQAVAATFAGFTAKEAIGTTMNILAGLGEVDGFVEGGRLFYLSFFPTNMVAMSFLMFNLFNTPCLAAVSVLYREISSKKLFWFAILLQNLGAYAISLVIYQLIGLALGEVGFSIMTVVAAAVLLLILYMLFRKERTPQARPALYGGVN